MIPNKVARFFMAHGVYTDKLCCFWYIICQNFYTASQKCHYHDLTYSFRFWRYIEKWDTVQILFENQTDLNHPQTSYSCCYFPLICCIYGLTRCDRFAVAASIERAVISWELRPGPTFSKLLSKILWKFLIFGQSLTISGKALTTHKFALLTY